MGESNEQAHPQNGEGGIQEHSPGFWRSFLIIAACTLTMISNVSVIACKLLDCSEPISSPSLLSHWTVSQQHECFNRAALDRKGASYGPSGLTMGGVGDMLLARFVWNSNAERIRGCLLLLFGRLADLHGRKKAFLAGSMWLVAFTLSCGFARGQKSGFIFVSVSEPFLDRQTLNVLRGMQGAGAAATIPAAVRPE
ncbi:hypothetical protein AAF712_007034 [Marasmius tenuissimus]|uniref:Uncharacterized protein n=1 Tax=Marasmius tenuissimus TaxID=585030 RepID=A0ABR2ZX27_9AGAR